MAERETGETIALKAAQKPQEKPSSEEETVQDQDELLTDFWQDLLDAVPPWFDEVVGVGMLIFGVLSALAVLNISQDAAASKAWSDTLRSLFGDGSVLISVGIFIMGIILLLPDGLVKLSTTRLLALEIAFFSTLPILHLYVGDVELRALARSGEGGGSFGWGLAIVPYWLFGSTITMMLFGLVLVLSIAAVVGIRQEHLTDWLSRNSKRLYEFGRRIEQENAKSAVSRLQTVDPIQAAGLSRLDPEARRSPANSVVRVRPDWANLPPSLRYDPAAAKKPEPLPEDEISERLSKVLEYSVDPSLVNKHPLLDEEIIGTLIEHKGKGPQLVARPDGRVKRYFSTEMFREQKKVGRREKDLPDLSILQDVEMEPPGEDEINRNVVLIENTLMEFDINVDVVDVKVGPTVTQYAVQPYREIEGEDGEIIKERTRLSRIAALADDLALALSAKRLRMETPVPGQTYMGIEVPNKNPSVVALRSVYESKEFYETARKKNSPLIVPLGRDVAGEPVIVDLAAMPHLLIAGTTGSGKSVCIAALASALVLNNPPDRVKMVMLDPKMVELSRFNGMPHLLGPVETDLERIIEVLRWCTREMDRRYKLLEEHAARNIETFNTRLGQRHRSEHLPYIVVFVDEIGDLMMSQPDATEKTVTRLAQMARAVGMHLVVATQRPSVDVITGLIKANFPGRIAFSVASSVDSRVILDGNGAETLLGYGDMLYLAPDAAGPKRVQGCYVDDDEVRRVVNHWKDWKEDQKQSGKWQTNNAPWERGLTRREFLSETDPMLEDAIKMVVEEQEASASQIQRKLGLGYPRAARLIDLLEELGVIGESVDGGRTRKVLIEKGKDPFQELIDRRMKK